MLAAWPGGEMVRTNCTEYVTCWVGSMGGGGRHSSVWPLRWAVHWNLPFNNRMWIYQNLLWFPFLIWSLWFPVIKWLPTSFSSCQTRTPRDALKTMTIEHYLVITSSLHVITSSLSWCHYLITTSSLPCHYLITIMMSLHHHYHDVITSSLPWCHSAHFYWLISKVAKQNGFD